MAEHGHLWVWGKLAERPRVLHTMVRVANLDRALEFYCGKLGMNVLARYDVEAGKFSIVFISSTSIDLAEALNRPCAICLHCLRLTDISDNPIYAIGCKTPNRRTQSSLVKIDKQHLRAMLKKELGARKADAAGAPGDDTNLVI